MLESYYQLHLENYLNGKHMRLKSGITDITNDDMHAEIKIWKDWSDAIGQLQRYCYHEHRKELRLYLFGEYTKKDKQDHIDVLISLNIKI